MKRATHYLKEVGQSMEQSLAQMPMMVTTSKTLPSSHQDILSYVEHLLTPRERQACDLATD